MKPRPVTFLISLGDVSLTVDSIWPDGDAPDNPTAKDVAELMREYGGAYGVVRDWDFLCDGIEVMDNTGNRETVR